MSGMPVDTAAPCKAFSPPSSNSVIATSPSSVHQNTRWVTGVSILPPAVMVSMTIAAVPLDGTGR